MPQPRISLTTRVLTVISHAPEPLKTHQVARSLGIRANVCRVLLGRLVDASRIQRLEKPEGVYFWIQQEAGGPYVWDLFR